MEMKLTPQEEQEILETFMLESGDKHEQFDKLLTSLESDLESKSILHDIGRVLHTLKGNAMSMGFAGIGDICHLLEEIFVVYKAGDLELNRDVFEALFKASDKVGELIRNVREDKTISYKGIKTRLEVILRDAKGEDLMVEDHVEEASTEITPEAIATDSEWIPEPEWQPKEEVVSQVSLPTHVEFPEELATSDRSFTGRISDWFRSVFQKQQKEEIVPVEEEREFLSDKEDRPSLTRDDESSVLDLFGDDDDTPVDEQVVFSEEPNELIADEIEDSTNDYREDLLAKLYDKVEVSDSVQVPIRKLDALMNQVGQLIIERDRLASKDDSRAYKAEFAGLQRITSDLQYSVMDVRLVQVGTLFNKFHRVVRDVAEAEGKSVTLQIKGSDVEIDRTVLKTISDSLIHLVRNAIGHGLESLDERRSHNKPETGTVTLSAFSDKDHVIIEVSDDGAGVNPAIIRDRLISKGLVPYKQAYEMSDQEVIMHIFHTGFSSAAQVNEISGRGVGMDVVKKSVESIGGQVYVDTAVSKGTTIRLKLPASLVVKGVLMFMMGDQEYAVPLAYTESVISLTKKDIRKAGLGLMTTFLDKPISVVFFSDLIEMEDFTEIYDHGNLHQEFDQRSDTEKFEVIVITHAGRDFGIVVDKLLQQKEIIEKPMPHPIEGNVLVSGTTILGTGNICMVIDAVSITEMLYSTKFKVYDRLKAS